MRKLIVSTLLFRGRVLRQLPPPLMPSSSSALVDMNKVFTAYFKTKDAEDKINDARAAAKKELDDRLETLQEGDGRDQQNEPGH